MRVDDIRDRQLEGELWFAVYWKMSDLFDTRPFSSSHRYFGSQRRSCLWTDCAHRLRWRALSLGDLLGSNGDAADRCVEAARA